MYAINTIISNIILIKIFLHEPNVFIHSRNCILRGTRNTCINSHLPLLWRLCAINLVPVGDQAPAFIVSHDVEHNRYNTLA